MLRAGVKVTDGLRLEGHTFTVAATFLSEEMGLC